MAISAHPHHPGHDHDHRREHGHGRGGGLPDPAEDLGEVGEGHVHAHGHSHDLKELGRRALVGALVLNAAFMVVEAVAGFASGSLALLSDAGHMLTDVLALSVALAAATFARASARGRFTYGLGRLTVLGALFNGLSALLIGGLIVFEAVERVLSPTSVQGLPVLVVGVLGLAVNLGSAWWLHRSGDTGVNMRGAMLHMMADALGSVAAIVSGAVLLATGFTLVDPIASVLVAGIVVASAVPLLRDVVGILLQGAPGHVDLEAMEDAARRLPEVRDVIGLHAWALDSGEAVASIVLVTGEERLEALNAAADRLREELERRFHVHHATIEWRHTTFATPCCPVEGDAGPAE